MKSGVTNLQSFKNSLKAANGRAQGLMTQRYRQFVASVLRDLAKNTPQWSGDLAASWQVVSGAGAAPLDLGDTPFKQLNYRAVDPLQKMGDRPAVDYAMQANELVIRSLRWNSIVSIKNVNPTVNELLPETLREENRPKLPGDYMGVEFVKMKYSTKKIQLGTDDAL